MVDKRTARKSLSKPQKTWVTGDEPMTWAQASYLATLCEETGAKFDAGLTKAQASLRITELQKRDPRLTKRRVTKKKRASKARRYGH